MGGEPIQKSLDEGGVGHESPAIPQGEVDERPKAIAQNRGRRRMRGIIPETGIPDVGDGRMAPEVACDDLRRIVRTATPALALPLGREERLILLK